MRLRSLDLRTADGLPPLPMHLSWVRDGIFVVGMDNEMQVYSQWKDTLCGISNGTGMAPTCTITVQGIKDAIIWTLSGFQVPSPKHTELNVHLL